MRRWSFLCQLGVERLGCTCALVNLSPSSFESGEEPVMKPEALVTVLTRLFPQEKALRSPRLVQKRKALEDGPYVQCLGLCRKVSMAGPLFFLPITLSFLLPLPCPSLVYLVQSASRVSYVVRLFHLLLIGWAECLLCDENALFNPCCEHNQGRSGKGPEEKLGGRRA